MRFAVRQIGFFFAIACLLVSCSRDPNVVKQKYLAKGKDYFAQEKYSEAAIEFGKAIQVDPNFGQAHYELGLDPAEIAAGLPSCPGTDSSHSKA